MAQDQWSGFEEVNAPSYPGVIAGRPKAPPAKNPYDIQTDQRDFGQDVRNTVVDDAAKLRSEFNALPQVKEYQTVIRQYDSALKTDSTPTGDQALITAYAKMLDPNSVVREQEFNTVANADSAYGKLVARIQKEGGFDGAGMLRPEVRERVRNEMLNLVKSYNSSYNQSRSQYQEFAQRAGVDPGLVVGSHLGEPFAKDIQDARQEYYQSKDEPQGVRKELGGGRISYDGIEYYTTKGPDGPIKFQVPENASEADILAAAEAARNGSNIPAEAAKLDKIDPLDGMDLAREGMAMGLTGEAAGVGTVISKALTGDFDVVDNYRQGRDVQDYRLGQVRDRLGAGGTALELLGGAGGVLSPAGSVMRAGRAVVNSGAPLTRAALGGRMVRDATVAGARVGALGGFGYGQGAMGSAVNTVAGGILGGAFGLAGQAGGNLLAARRAGAPTLGREVIDAGNAEGITVNRAMIDQASNNAVTKADATLIGGRKVQREMSAIEDQIADRVTGLGSGGTAMVDSATGGIDRIALGDKVRGASERFIEKSGRAAKAKYDRAERLAGDAKVEPKESLQVVDDAIASLSETASTNSAEVQFLTGLKDDLSKDLSVGGLRRLRTKLRKTISKGDLVFGEDEARVLSVMEAAANDIEAGLVAQGKGDAAKAFRRADTAYRARMDYINGTVQKIIGKRNATLSAEQVAGKFNSLSANDARGLRKFYATLDPDEAADVAATFAEQLGKNNKGEFTPTQFLRQTKTMSDEAARTMFGPDGLKSIRNLRTISKEVERVTGAMNSRTSKSGVANYRDWLWTLATGGGSLITSNLTTAAAATAAVGAGTAAKHAISARLLMSPAVSKWLASAPKTVNPSQINSHLIKLGNIARIEPALAGEIESARSLILSAANDVAPPVQRAAADDEQQQRQD